MSYQTRLNEYRYFADGMKRNGEEINFNSKGGLFRAGVRPEMDAGGVSAEEAIHQFESSGQMPGTREPEDLYWLLLGKYARDWHITQWTTGGFTPSWELLDDGVPRSLVDTVRKTVWRRLGLSGGLPPIERPDRTVYHTVGAA